MLVRNVQNLRTDFPKGLVRPVERVDREGLLFFSFNILLHNLIAPLS